MSKRNFTKLRYLLVFIFLFGYKIVCSQVRNPNIAADSLKTAGLLKPDSVETDPFEKLERAVGGKEKLQQTQQQLLLLKQQAIKSHDDNRLAHALYELMKISDLLTEDSLYFKNSAFMDTLLNAPSSSPTLKAIVHVMRAMRVNNFDHRGLRFNRAAYRSKNIPVDYASLTSDERDSLWTKDLTAALAYHAPAGDAKKLRWLSSDPDVFLFDAQFADIVLAEYVNQAALKNYYSFNPGPTAGTWPSLPSDEFRNKLDSIAKNDKRISILGGYQRWLSFNKANKATAAFIESLARKFIFSFTASDSLSHQAYISYLRTQTTSPYPALKAHSIYQLCLIWNEAGNKYFSDPFGYSYSNSSAFDKKYQYLPDSALQLFEKNKVLLGSYPQFHYILTLMADQIRARGLSISMMDKFIPDENIPIRVLYKNADTLYYRIIRINSEEPAGHQIVTATPELMNRRPVASGFFALPLPPDHNNHSVYLKLPPLPIGKFRLLFNYAELKGDGQSIYNIPFQVTAISAINSDERIYVLNRKTGAPLAGAVIQAFKKGVSVPDKAVRRVKKEGYTIMPDDMADSISIAYKGDTLGYRFTIHDNERSDDENIYDKDEYDDLDDFYDRKLSMHIFTDRSIYRPGQTVHYKVMLLTRNQQTGDLMIFNRANLGGIFSNRVKTWLKKNNSIITLSDPFNHQVDSAIMAPNDFGSFAGSFILPKTAATGGWDIDGKADRDYQNKGRFRVEEYKRPTIELSMEKQKKMLRSGQPFTIKLKLRSFSGGDLGNIPIKYTVSRSGRLPASKITNSGYNNYLQRKLSDTVGYTNEKGELSLPVNDTSLAKYKWGDDDADNYNYTINATATDATGETTEINESVNISSRPIKIKIQLDKIYDRRSLPSLSVNASADFEGVTGRNVAIKIYAVSDPDLTGNNYNQTDQWYYPEAEWNKWFPALASDKRYVPTRRLVLDTVINTASYGKLVLPKEKLNTGFYELTADCRDDDKVLIGRMTNTFKVFDSAAGTAPGNDLNYMPVNSAKPGDVITWYNFNKTNTYTIYQVLYTAGKKNVLENIYSELTEQPGLQHWAYRIPANATGNLTFTRIYVLNNQIIKNNKTVYLYKPESAQPEIIIEKYRKVMAPGAEETFTLSVKTKNENTASELMTTLYDASLDKLNQHTWTIPNQSEYHSDPWTQWPYSLSLRQQTGNFAQNAPVVLREVRPQQYGYYSDLNGRAAGVSVTSSPGLNEVVVVSVGYGTEKRRDLTGSISTVTVRGIGSLADYKQPLIIVDGEIYTGDLNKFNAGAITQAMVLKGADASGIYGTRAAEGVLIISTKGPIILPEAPEPVVKVRKNFNETAFFFPQVHAGTDGYYSFSFTMPESATEWNWKILAHTKKAQFAYLERKLQTQLSLMVQPNMPRLLYQGDKLKLQSRITNLDTINVAGKITCKIEDAVTGEDITSLLLGKNQQTFTIDKKSSGSAYFELNVPAEQLNPLKIVISASAPGAADAEEHIIPVLSSKILVRQSLPVKFDKQSVVTITSVKLPADAQLFGIGVSIGQKPQATLVNSLPWLANYSYDCAEQIFNKLNALATALKLMQKDTLAQKMCAQASRSIDKEQPKDAPLPDEMVAEATPWISIGTQAATQQKQLFKILDTAASKNDIGKHLERLYKLQQPNGGLAWFEDGKSNEYISAYVLAGFGRLKQQGWRLNISENVRFQQFINDLYKYNAACVLKSDINNYDVYQVYALSYWSAEHSASNALTAHINLLLNAAWKNADKNSLGKQALLIINTFSYNAPGSVLYQKAQNQLEDINQLAIQDNQNGLRWKDISDAEELNTSAEETMALLDEAFALSTKYPQMNAGMVKWLLTTRQDQHWQTTKATAAAIDMLQKGKGSVIGENKSFSAEVAGQHLSVSDDLLNGVPAAFVAAKQLPAAITLQQQGTNASGALTWYYFTKAASLDTLNKAVHISKQFYSYDKNKGWILLTSDIHLKTGDKVRVKLTIETSSRLKFIHISDPRAAAFEPADNNSGYQYNDGLSYYQSVKDTGLEIFTESVPRGISEISYEMIVAMDGQFTSGPARLQCMYQPSVTAYSDTERIVTN